MRQKQDTCLLCRANLSTKENSHILPKFLTRGFLGEKRRGFRISSHKILRQKPRITQDSPKENYLLCDECEAYFGVIEGITSGVFTNWRGRLNNGDFISKPVIPGVSILECNNIDHRVVYLLIYSIFWRVSISEDGLFREYKLDPTFEDELRLLLLRYKQTKKSDFINSLDQAPNVNIFPVTIITAESFIDETANILFAPLSRDPYCLVVDKFSFMLSRTNADIDIDFFRSCTNFAVNECKMLVFSPQLWYNSILKEPFRIMAEQAVKENKE